jgi:transposase
LDLIEEITMTNAELQAEIAVLKVLNAELCIQAARVPILEAQLVVVVNQNLILSNQLAELGKKIDQILIRKDSSNSSLPPSSDLFKRNQSTRTPSGLKPGGQKNHKGTTLKMVETPDKIEVLIPQICSICSSELDASKAILVGRRQVIDIPPIRPQITEYQSYKVVCNCGKHQVGTFPVGVDNHIQYGPNVVAQTVYHYAYQYIPFKRLQDYFKHVCNLPISIGTLENIIFRMADKSRPTWDGYRQEIEQSEVLGSDETGAKVNGKKYWIWAWQTTKTTFLSCFDSRKFKVIDTLFPNGFPKATLCSDRLGAQLKTKAKNHQICLAHLLRELKYFIEVEKTPWATQFNELLKDAIALSKDAITLRKNETIDNDKHLESINEIKERLTNLLQQNIADKDALKTITFHKSMIKHTDNLFLFLDNPKIPFDNNASERSIRNVKVKLKVSGQFKSMQECYCILRSVIDTTIKNGKSVFEAIAHLANPLLQNLAAV